MKKKKVCIITGFYKPGYLAGGPIQSIYNLSNLLNQDFDIHIITQNFDLGAEKEVYNVETNVWISRDEGVRVMYLNKRDFLFQSRKKCLEIQPDVIYLNSFFATTSILSIFYFNYLKRKNKIKLIIAPRGEFDPGALKIKKLKKSIYILFFKIFSLRKNNFHATTALEKQNIDTVLKNNNIYIAENIPKKALGSIERVKEKYKTTLLFYSRISPKKNLKFCIDFLVNNKFSGEISFLVAGPKEDFNYWNKCEREVKNLPENINFEYIGSVKHDEIDSLFKKCHYLFFPTLGENFGHVIYEALASGMPILISDKTPWENKGFQNGVFTNSLTDVNGFKNHLEKLHSLNDEEYKKLSENSFSYSKQVIDLKKIKQQYYKMLEI
ncbi:glycosyltransferase [Tenacibaculum sp. 190524A05c]|uniref:Glycosyltransferase involved in cell wall bisynthesis n=1 Tax=Tenacibaculum platacis TaxID=3137852 RepID=A0ABM9P4A1_9FLAO